MSDNPKPDSHETVMMSSTALKPPAPKPALPAASGSNRLRYEVRAVGDRWEIIADNVRVGDLFASSGEATMAARVEARQQWIGNARPTRVVLIRPDGETMVALYGHEPPPPPGTL